MPIVAPMIQFLSAGALLTGLVCVSWARRSHARASKFEMRARQARERAEATLRVYEALLNHGNQGIVVLNPPGEGRQYFAQGKEMFEACIDHPESGRAVRAFDALVAKGTACSFRLPTPEGCLAVRGLPLAGRAVLYLQEEAIPAKSDRDHQIPEALPLAAVASDITQSVTRPDPAAQEDIFDRVPLAMAVFDAEQKLVRYNTAYAQLWGLAKVWLDSHPSYGDVLARLREQRKLPEQRNFGDWKQTQIQAFATPGLQITESWHLPDGQSIRITIQRPLQGGVFVLYEDVSDELRLQASLRLQSQVQRATLDLLDDGVAIFGTDGRLVLHNTLFAKMWQLSEEETAGQPHFTQIANLCTTRFGRDGIWAIVPCGINSSTPELWSKWTKATRQDGRQISLSMTRLPNGATAVTFCDVSEVDRFGIALEADNHAAA